MYAHMIVDYNYNNDHVSGYHYMALQAVTCIEH